MTRPMVFAGALALLLLAVALAKYWWGLFPAFDRMRQIAMNWQSPADPNLNEDYLLASPVSALLAGILGLSGSRGFLLLHLFLVALALCLPFLMPAVRTSRTRAHLVFVLLVGGPIAAVLVTWLGSYDAVSVIAMTIAALARWRMVALVGWLLLAFNHGQLAVAALLLSLPILLWSMREQAPRQKWIAVLAPVAVIGLGIALNTALLTSWGANSSRFEVVLRVGLETFTRISLMYAPLIVFSVLGAGWFLLLEPRIRRSVDGRIMLVTALVAAVVLPLISLDQSRIPGLALLVPLLIWTGVLSAEYPPKYLERLWRRWWIPALITPVVLVYVHGLVYPGWSGYLGLGPVDALLKVLPG
jgi:hypothetical protein